MANTVLKLNNFTVVYKTQNGPLEAVRNVSFELKEGETLAIVVRIRHSKTLKNLLKVFKKFNMIMDLIPRKNKTVRLKRQARTKAT